MRHDIPPMPTLADAERAHILAVLELTGDNVAHAAQVLGINRRTLYRKLDSYAASGRGRQSETR